MADIFPADLSKDPAKPRPCPIDGSAFPPASHGIIRCNRGHEFTLCPEPLGIVRIDNVSFAERLTLLREATVAFDLFMQRMAEIDEAMRDLNLDLEDL